MGSRSCTSALRKQDRSKGMKFQGHLQLFALTKSLMLRESIQGRYRSFSTCKNRGKPFLEPFLWLRLIYCLRVVSTNSELQRQEQHLDSTGCLDPDMFQRSENGGSRGFRTALDLEARGLTLTLEGSVLGRMIHEFLYET